MEFEVINTKINQRIKTIFHLMFTFGMFVHEMYIIASKVTNFKLECK